IIGANGAGKSTTLRALSGIAPKAWGTVEFLGADVLKRSPRGIVGAGLVHVPEGRRLFADMTVKENLMLGAVLQTDAPAIQERLEYVFGLFPILRERSNQLAGTLSGGQQQMCAISRGLMARPKLLMLDEPSLGLAPVLVEKVFEVLLELKRDGVTILLVEQNAHLALEIADWGLVLETGRIAQRGPAQELLADPDLRKAYLGG
ncbi:MAG: ABC transporter ATP-binding protein, partial [Planctomycetota bacterium]